MGQSLGRFGSSFGRAVQLASLAWRQLNSFFSSLETLLPTRLERSTKTTENNSLLQFVARAVKVGLRPKQTELELGGKPFRRFGFRISAPVIGSDSIKMSANLGELQKLLANKYPGLSITMNVSTNQVSLYKVMTGLKDLVC